MDTVRSDYVVYKPFQVGHREWQTNGWRTLQAETNKIKSAAITRQHDLSSLARESYVSKLQIVDVVAALDESGTGYWLVECMSKSVEADQVVFTTTRNYPEYGIEAGHSVLNITWFERVGECEPPTFKLVDGSCQQCLPDTTEGVVYTHNSQPLLSRGANTRTFEDVRGANFADQSRARCSICESATTETSCSEPTTCFTSN